MIVDSNSSDIVYSNLFTGVHGNYLKGSIAAAGLDPADLPESDPSTRDFTPGATSTPKPGETLGCWPSHFLFRT